MESNEKQKDLNPYNIKGLPNYEPNLNYNPDLLITQGDYDNFSIQYDLFNNENNYVKYLDKGNKKIKIYSIKNNYTEYNLLNNKYTLEFQPVKQKSYLPVKYESDPYFLRKGKNFNFDESTIIDLVEIDGVYQVPESYLKSHSKGYIFDQAGRVAYDYGHSYFTGDLKVLDKWQFYVNFVDSQVEICKIRSVALSKKVLN